MANQLIFSNWINSPSSFTISVMPFEETFDFLDIGNDTFLTSDNANLITNFDLLGLGLTDVIDGDLTLTGFSSLSTLGVDWAKLNSITLDTASRSGIQSLHAEGNRLATFDFTNMTELVTVNMPFNNISANPNITSTKLEWLGMDSNALQTVSTDQNENLRVLKLNNNPDLYSVVLATNCTALEFVECYGANLAQSEMYAMLYTMDQAGVNNCQIDISGGTNAVPDTNTLDLIISLQSRSCNVIYNTAVPSVFDKFAYGNETGTERFLRLRNLGYV